LYLFGFQQALLKANTTPVPRSRFAAVLRPSIAANFTQTPSTMTAFLAMTGNTYANLAANDQRLLELQGFAICIPGSFAPLGIGVPASLGLA